ncbi:pyridoxamine 5'-phosphate oxidase family protein [Micromonospora sp. WMMD712]|uniref:pyridoxamine 5'-phosphate oxidase family protein n=1 Tax=Micromonospora sp. WMMD712 TaxID=3016096 RepID=UPI00249CF100|nr:pyridoxamine 5'-phosphate oxidase family protein [Micromonospora sp. WMMD712]WFE58325.1 pyridoxamine 5'-phosphate oxidase family protein [Micromonospora sp. WMMD712]
MIGRPAPGPEVLDRLARERIVWLCTVRPDGSPHVTPVWFLFRDDEWCIWTQERNRKVRNIVADPRVSLALPDGKFPVVAEGAAVIVREPFPGWAADEFRRKYDWDVTAPAGSAGDNVLIRVAVTRWLMAGSAS